MLSRISVHRKEKRPRQLYVIAQTAVYLKVGASEILISSGLRQGSSSPSNRHSPSPSRGSQSRPDASIQGCARLLPGYRGECYIKYKRLQKGSMMGRSYVLDFCGT